MDPGGDAPPHGAARMIEFLILWLPAAVVTILSCAQDRARGRAGARAAEIGTGA